MGLQKPGQRIRLGIGIPIRLILGLLVCLALTGSARAWVSTPSAEGLISTHHFILREAFRRLAADPAFDPGLFPTRKEILAKEGIGVGPDNHALAPYSAHYYNPSDKGLLPHGGAPARIAGELKSLIRAGLQGRGPNPARQAAWAAHLLADLGSPFHVNGVQAAAAKEYWEDGQGRDGDWWLELPPGWTGNLTCYAGCWPRKVHDGNFLHELQSFIRVTGRMKQRVDWFDPWLKDGLWSDETTHGRWERDAQLEHRAALALLPSGPGPADPRADLVGALTNENPRAGFYNPVADEEQGPGGVDNRPRITRQEPWPTPGCGDHQPAFPCWRNPTPGFDRPWEKQANQAVLYAARLAAFTRDRFRNRMGPDMAPALSRSILAVQALWRSSFSGLRPNLREVAQGDRRTLIGTIRNAAGEKAAGVRARLVSRERDGRERVIEERAVGDLEPLSRDEKRIGTWTVPTVPGRAYRLEVIGRYRNTPDLQYAVASTGLGLSISVRPQKPRVGREVTLTARLSGPAPGVGYVWRLGENTAPRKTGTSPTIGFRPHRPGRVQISVQALSRDGKKVLAQAKIVLEIRPKTGGGGSWPKVYQGQGVCASVLHGCENRSSKCSVRLKVRIVLKADGRATMYLTGGTTFREGEQPNTHVCQPNPGFGPQDWSAEHDRAGMLRVETPFMRGSGRFTEGSLSARLTGQREVEDCLRFKDEYTFNLTRVK